MSQLIIDSSLSAPPSKVYCFRDLTLYAKCFAFDIVLLKCESGTRTFYRDWLKSYGAFDFVDDLILKHEEEYGFTIGTVSCNINIDRISYENLNFLISSINCFKNSQ